MFINIKVNLKVELNMENQKSTRDKENLFRLLTEISDDMVMQFDRDFVHLYANPASARYLGTDLENITGKTHAQMGYRKEEYEPWHARIEKVFKTGVPHKEVYHNTVLDKWFDWNLFPELGKDNYVISVISYTRDITELIHYQQKLQESNSTKDRLFSILAHDLRGPIGSLEQMLNLFSMEELDDETRSVIMDDIKVTVKSSFTLLDNLLNWARIQSGPITMHPEKLCVKSLLENVCKLLESQADQKLLSITVNGEESAYIYSDSNSSEMVLRNLLSNAIKFTPEGGLINVSWHNEGDFIRISLSDNGVGIERERLENLFRLTTNTTWGTKGEKGTGLGLVLVKEFVEKNGGNIEVTSTPGKGSTFSFTLPKFKS